MTIVGVLYVPNSPTLVGPMPGWDGHPQNELALSKLGKALKAETEVALVVSPHFVTGDSLAAVGTPRLRQVYDFQGFPEAFYRVRYEPPGAPDVARELELLTRKKGIPFGLTEDWGLDHGAWSALLHLFPGADVPVVPLSISPHLGTEAHVLLGGAARELARTHRVLVIATGSLIHNFDLLSDPDPETLRSAREYLHAVETALGEGDWEGVWDIPELLYRAAEPEGGELPLRFLSGVLTGPFRAHVLAEETLRGALSMTTIRFEERKDGRDPAPPPD